METKKKVLIVEDDLVLSKALEKSLGERYEVLTAYDGVEAETKIYETKPDLILLDLLLPIKNGFEILRNLRNDGEMKEVPVVILTNFEQDSSIEEGTALGVKEYVVKANIDIDEVPGIVARYV